MNLKRISLLMLLCAAALAVASYESYRTNADFVNKLASSTASQEMFKDLEPGVPIQSQITGFFAVVLGVAGLKLLVSSFSNQRLAPSEGDLL